jgi:SAM-dependent methyltransferase
LRERQASKLHLGCFSQVHPGWVNTDVTPHLFVTRVPGLPALLHKLGLISADRLTEHRSGAFRGVYYLDAARKFPLPNSRFDYVFTSHMLEHLYPEEGETCIREIYRVLRPNGVVRISVPDLDLHVAEYNCQNPNSFLDSIFGYTGSGRGRKHRNKWWYNEESLSLSLRQAGFREVYRCTFRQGRCADVELLDNRPRSLFMEGVK